MTKLAPLPFGRTMKAAHVRPQEIGEGPGAVKAGELVSAVYVDGASPSTVARKVYILLLARAAGSAWEDRWHTVTKSDLGMGHQSMDRVHDAMDDLVRTLLRIRVTNEDGSNEILTGAIISEYRVTTHDSPQAKIQWRFSLAMREAMRLSNHYAELHIQISSAMESRYSVTLYEMGCQHQNRNFPIWHGTVDDLRAQLGVPSTYRDWTDVRRRCLEPAMKEVNQIAPFVVRANEIRKGRAVHRLEIIFERKGD